MSRSQRFWGWVRALLWRWKAGRRMTEDTTVRELAVSTYVNPQDDPLSRQVRRAIARRLCLAYNRRTFPSWLRRDIRNKALRGISPVDG